MPRKSYVPSIVKWAHKSTPQAAIHPTMADLAWAAGFLEGEGHFGVNDRNTHASTVVRATQKNLEPLHRLQRILGGTVNPCRSDGFGEWRTYGVRARGIMFTLFSFLSARKRTQIIDALGGF